MGAFEVEQQEHFAKLSYLHSTGSSKHQVGVQSTENTSGLLFVTGPTSADNTSLSQCSKSGVQPAMLWTGLQQAFSTIDAWAARSRNLQTGISSESQGQSDMHQTSLLLTIHDGSQVDEDMAPGGAASPTISASSATASHTLFQCL